MISFLFFALLPQTLLEFRDVAFKLTRAPSDFHGLGECAVLHSPPHAPLIDPKHFRDLLNAEHRFNRVHREE